MNQVSVLFSSLVFCFDDLHQLPTFFNHFLLRAFFSSAWLQITSCWPWAVTRSAPVVRGFQVVRRVGGVNAECCPGRHRGAQVRLTDCDPPHPPSMLAPQSAASLTACLLSSGFNDLCWIKQGEIHICPFGFKLIKLKRKNVRID